MTFLKMKIKTLIESIFKGFLLYETQLIKFDTDETHYSVIESLLMTLSEIASIDYYFGRNELLMIRLISLKVSFNISQRRISSNKY